MHLVFLNQYHPPDAAPTGVMLAAVVEELRSQGHRVTVICAAGGYAEAAGARPARDRPSDAHSADRSDPATGNDTGCRVIRIRATRFGRGTFLGKLADYASYYLGVAFRLAVIRPRPGRIVALTTPPYLAVLARAMSKPLGCDHAHWVMDVYPDVMVAHGMLRDSGIPHRLLAGLAGWGIGGNRAAARLTLGPDMAATLARQTRGTAPEPAWIPLWSTEPRKQRREEDNAARIAARRREMGWTDDQMIVMYSGNMGLGHRFSEILEVIRGTPARHPPPARFVFFGAGKRRDEIEAFLAERPDAPVELHDYAPAEILHTHLMSADVHLASLDAKWTGTMLPSKLQGIFTAGRPVIFIGDSHSAISRWIDESGGGWVVAPGDTRALARAIDEARDPDVRESRGGAAAEFAAAHFQRGPNAARAATLLAAPR